jgi:hypothetical protein
MDFPVIVIVRLKKRGKKGCVPAALLGNKESTKQANGNKTGLKDGCGFRIYWHNLTWIQIPNFHGLGQDPDLETDALAITEQTYRLTS